jgi:hypothetical protein
MPQLSSLLTLIEILAIYTTVKKKKKPDNLFPTFHESSVDHVPNFWSIVQM